MTTVSNASPENIGGALVSDFEPQTRTLTLRPSGRLDSAHISTVWEAAVVAIDKLPSPPARILVDASDVVYCDVSGIAFFIDLQRRHATGQTAVEIQNLSDESRSLLSLFKAADYSTIAPPPPRARPFFEDLGAKVRLFGRDFARLLEFTGALAGAFGRALRKPRKIRWRDALLVAERAGADAVPIVCLLGFLMGLIIAFQAAIPMSKFGAEIYVADLVAIATLRELGPLMTCIILAGRSGSAFAAEIGTMKINEEINALKTMSVDPVGFLVIPRVIAAIFITPLLTLFANIMGIVGAGIVVLSMGYPLVTYVREVLSMTTLGDLNSGLLKSVVFGLLVAAIGCLRGLQTRTGPDAVGVSATRAVVSGITLIVVTDGIFAVLFYYVKF